MFKNLRVILSALILFVFLLSMASAETNLSEMSLSELSDLRDLISQEINNRALPQSVITIDCDAFTMNITSFEEGGKSEVNHYYDIFEPGIGTPDDSRRFIFLFELTNKSDDILDLHLENVSINEWMTSGYLGLRDIEMHKKARGFANLEMAFCDAETIDEVQSVEFTISSGSQWSGITDYVTVHLVRSGDGFVLAK